MSDRQTNPASTLPSYMATSDEKLQSETSANSFSAVVPTKNQVDRTAKESISSSMGLDFKELLYSTKSVTFGSPDSFESKDESDNEIEAKKDINNYLFGFKKWKSRLSVHTSLDSYGDLNKIVPETVSTVRPTNILYVLVFGWWLSLIYVIVGILLTITYVGRAYGPFCWRMAKYFLWPFGKFVHQMHSDRISLRFEAAMNGGVSSYQYDTDTTQSTSFNGDKGATESTELLGDKQEDVTRLGEKTALLTQTSSIGSQESGRKPFSCDKAYWTRPQTIIWLILGCPLLLLAHGIIIFTSWLLVVTIPTAKVNIKTVQKILFLPPETVQIGDSEVLTMTSEILMYTHQSVNFRYYKYKVDGMNIVLVNLLLFVVMTLILGYADKEDKYAGGFVKCVMSLLAIVPLTYYIGMGIACIAAQSILAVGAILNATFGSAVEIILYIIFLFNGLESSNNCYIELVKSAMAGTLLATMMLIPGLSMVAGGLKYRTQTFNPQSAGVSASLLFVSVAGIFAPTIFSKVYGTLQCKKCEDFMTNSTSGNGSHMGLQCSDCEQSIFGINGDTALYDSHIKPLVYACAIMLPISYIIGLVFTLKTHRSLLYDTSMDEEESTGHHGQAQWSKKKAAAIMLVSAVFISLCADVATENIQPLLQVSGISEYFIGVTLLAVLPDLPELVNGILFALQDNVALGLEIGSSAAVQVCLVQIPTLVLIDLIYPFGFYLVFNDIHFYAVLFSVIVMNYTIQDGKSNYFQGWILLGIYLVILAMYFFTPVPPSVKCSS